MTKTKIKVVGGEKNTKRLRELFDGDLFIFDDISIIRTFMKTSRIDQDERITCVDVYSGEIFELQPNHVPKTVYRKMKVKLYE